MRPCDVECVEAHGTGTGLGDPTEAGALVAVHGTDERVVTAEALMQRLHRGTYAGKAGGGLDAPPSQGKRGLDVPLPVSGLAASFSSWC